MANDSKSAPVPAPTKQVIALVTLHVKDDSKFRPFRYDQNSGTIQGVYAITDYAPGSLVTLDADEADSLIARKQARDPDVPEEVAPPSAAVPTVGDAGKPAK